MVTKENASRDPEWWDFQRSCPGRDKATGWLNMEAQVKGHCEALNDQGE